MHDTNIFVLFAFPSSCNWWELARSLPVKRQFGHCKASTCICNDTVFTWTRRDNGCGYTIVHYIIVYYTTLHYTTLYYTIIYYAILYYTTLLLYYIILYYIISYYTTILCYTILSYTNGQPDQPRRRSQTQSPCPARGLRRPSSLRRGHANNNDDNNTCTYTYTYTYTCT